MLQFDVDVQQQCLSVSDEVSNNAMNLSASAGHFQKFVTVMFCFVTHCHCHECHVISSSLSQR